MTHRSADRLSEAIDGWLRGGSLEGQLADVLHELAEAFPDVADELAKERVRRRLTAFKPNTATPQELLLERAGDNLERLARRFTEDEYVPWPTLAGAAVVVVVAAVAVAWLRRPKATAATA